MTNAAVQLRRNLPPLLQRSSVEELFTMAQCLHHELARRGLDARLEAGALEAALLIPARQEHHDQVVDELAPWSCIRDA